MASVENNDLARFDDYQKQALTTAVFPGKGTFLGLMYCALKLNGEAGEVAEKIGKIWRDNNGEISPVKSHDLVIELGDVLWYIAALSHYLGVDLHHVASENIAKLASRKARGTLQGEGDNR